MIKRLTLLCIAVVCCFFFTPVFAQEDDLELDYEALFSETAEDEEQSSVWSDLRVSGYLKNETAYRIREPRSITKIRNIAYLNLQYPFGNRVDFNFTGWAYHDLVYDLFNYETIAARLERNSEEPLAFVENLAQEKDSPVAEVRELYFDVGFDRWDVRIGKQYIIWGVLEGIRVVDEINPMDFRELILPDLIDYRIPLWSTKFDFYANFGDIQLVWIPDLQFHNPAPPGSEWELLQEVPGTRSPESWELENSEIGIKLDTYFLNTELSFSYFYTWDDFPVIFRTVKIGASADEGPVFYPSYTRISMYGMTLVKPVGNYILKGEFAYVEDKFFGRSNIADVNGDGYVDTNGEAQKDHIRWGLGVDFVLLSWDVALGMMQWVILDYEENLIQNRVDTSYNVFIRREFPASSMTVQALWIYLQDLDETYLKPKVIFQITDKFQIGVGLDLFDGNKSDFGLSTVTAQGQFNAAVQRAQFLGNFHNNDRLFFEFKYSF